MSADRDTALKVGARRGDPVILIVDTAAMHTAGSLFYQADNGVWLTDHVVTKSLKQPNKDARPIGQVK